MDPELKAELAGIIKTEVQTAVDAGIEKARAEAPDPKPVPVQTQAAVKSEERTLQRVYVKETLNLIRGMFDRSGSQLIRTSANELARHGFYGDQAEELVRGAGDYYSTVVLADGGYLLPTVVRDGIEDVATLVGAVRPLSDVFPHIVGDVRVVAGLNKIVFTHVGEGQAIKSTKRSFGAVTLNPKKVACIVPLTIEIGIEAGAKVLGDVQRKAGEGLGEIEDQTAIYGDGSATYNGMVGLFDATRTGVGAYALAAGNVTFDSLTPDDMTMALRALPPGARRGAGYIFHPDMELVFLTQKDGAGAYVWADYRVVDGVQTFKGKPVRFTEVLPGLDTVTQTSTKFGIVGNFSYWKMATGAGMSAEELREGTVEDADDATPINLASMDIRALKMRAFFDMDTNFEECFAAFTTPAS